MEDGRLGLGLGLLLQLLGSGELLNQAPQPQVLGLQFLDPHHEGVRGLGGVVHHAAVHDDRQVSE